MVEDVTHLLDKERGTAFDDTTALFSDFDEGAAFNYDAATIRDIDRMFEQDGKARTLEQVLTLPIRQAPFSIQRGRARAEVHKFVENALLHPANNGGMTTPMNTVIAQMCGAIVYRKAFFEKVLTEKEIEGKSRITYSKLAYRPASTCSIVRDPRTGAFKGFKQRPVVQGQDKDVLFGPQSAFVYIHGKHRNPLEGVSDMDIAWWCFQTKQKIRFLWYQYLEGQSLPKTIVRDRDLASAQKAARKVLGLRTGGIVALEAGTQVDTLESSGKGADQFKAALQWLDIEASGSVLASFTDLGGAAAGGTGSFSLSKDQTDFFLMSRQATSREMQDDINQFVIPDLVAYNFGPNEVSPTFEFGPIAEDDAGAAISLLQATAQTPAAQSQIPREFMGELIERVAGFLELDTQIVRAGIERAAKEAEEKAKAAPVPPPNPEVAAVSGAVNEATRMVQEGVRDATGDEPVPAP